ncbi:MAG: hypothetical protein KAF40_11000, partial [Flavihumibacter sp.]|nr:hypothetical protein [Flavihumibacter sp.]
MKNRLLAFSLGASFYLLAGCKNQPAQTDLNQSWMLTGFEKIDSVNPCLTPGLDSFPDPISNKQVQWEKKDVFNPAAVVRNGKIYLLFRAEDTIGRYNGTSRIGLAESEDGIHFIKRKEPVLFPQ